ncbi:MAG: TonB-dependent receptor [Flavobacterium sp.]|nr:TonB-dependent receptor [Flavobacterium sp.]
MNLKTKLTLIVFFLFNVVVFAQDNYKLTGKVTDAKDNSPIPGVNVQMINSKAGTTTDFDGIYSIVVSKGDKIQFSFIGYASKTITITNEKTLDVKLSGEESQLEQVVVVGYGTQKRSNLTGSISKVTNKTLDQIPVSRVDDALSGQISGINIQQTNPTAGSAPTIKVRGQGSISFNSSPLIVVDGIAVGNDGDFLGSIDMNTVDSVEVLKDASSSSIYGSRGANGVIMITTKKGKEGITKFSYNTYTGYKFVPSTNIFPTPAKWSQYVLDNNGGVLTDQMKMINQMGTYTNWENVLIDGGLITDHSLSISGGNENTKFRTSLGYNNDEGVLLTDNYKKLNLSLNLDTKVNKLEYGIIINPSVTEQKAFPTSFQNVIRQQPWLPIYLDENSIKYVNPYVLSGRFANVKVGDYAEEQMFQNYDLITGKPVATGGTSINATGDGNPYAAVVEQKSLTKQTKIYANTYFKINFSNNFSFKQTVGGDYRSIVTDNRTGVKATKNYSADAISTYNSTAINHFVSESIFNYNKDFGKHSIAAVAGYAMENWHSQYVGLTGTGYTSDLVETIAPSNVGVGGGSTSETAEKLVSYISRVNYSYDNKYLLMVSFRTDGSSKFGTNNKFGYFPAFSVGWKISNEKFLENSKVISDLKLRASYGETGSNSGIGEYAHLGLVSAVGTGLTGSSTGYNQTNVENPILGWEKLVEFNPGIDATLFGGAFGFSFDYYTRTSKDLLLNLPIPSVTGFSTSLLNKGEVKNEGFEIELRSTNIRKKDFSWTSSALFTINKNTLVDFAGSNGVISVVEPKRAAEWIALEGHPISSFYGYQVSHQIENQYIKNPLYPINIQSQDIYVKDINNDGKIDSNDRSILGDPYPDLVWSFTNNLKYKNIDFSFMFQGSHGAKVRNIDSQYYNNEFNTNADYDPAKFTDGALVKERIFTSDDIQDASYIALRNLNLGYTFNSEIIKKMSLSRLRLYFGAQNLMYLKAKNYTGYNPEGILPASTSVPTSPLTYGYQKGATPIYKTISFGLNVEF